MTGTIRVRILAIILVLGLSSFSLVACAPEEPEQEWITPSAESESSTATMPSDAPLPTAEQFSALGHPTIVIREEGFMPAELEIAAGMVVMWVNQDDVDHAVKIGPDGPESPPIPAGQIANHKFEEAGTFEYTDPLNPGFGGVVIVH